MSIKEFHHNSYGRYVDLHCHGGGGFNFTDQKLENVQVAIQFHKANGTDKLIASLVTAEISELKEQIRRLVPLCKNGELAGIHLEGPYLSKARCGAHNPSQLKAPDLREISDLFELAEGALKMITFAPELPGALAAIELTANKGAIAAIGHSDGSYQDALNAVDAGANLVTHFSNAMSKLRDGDKTFATALLYESSLPLEIIFDNVHVDHNELSKIFDHAKDRIILVTDAMAAAGQADGRYSIGDLEVVVKEGIARLSSNQALAGSTLTMNQAVSNAIAFGFSADLIENAAINLPNRLLHLG